MSPEQKRAWPSLGITVVLFSTCLARVFLLTYAITIIVLHSREVSHVEN